MPPFFTQTVHPGDLKKAVEGYLNELLKPIRAEFSSPEMKDLVAKAYPEESKEKKGESIITTLILIVEVIKQT